MELLGWAPDRDAMVAWLKDMGWANRGNGVLINCQISEIGPVVEFDNSDPPVETKRVDGYHFNIRLYGGLAQRMLKRPRLEEDSFWDHTNIKAEIERKMVRSQTLKTRVEGGLPEGYEDSIHQVRVYPAENVNNRKNVWA